MSDGEFGMWICLITFGGITAAAVKTSGAAPAAVTVGVWVGAALLGAAVFVVLVQLVKRGRQE